MLDVHSIFYTLQGEGPFTGRPAVFVRLAGCNLQCPMCDTQYTEGRLEYSPQELVQTVLSIHRQESGNHMPTRNFLVVITGGEPFRQNLDPFVSMMLTQGAYIQIETNGTFEPTVSLNIRRDISNWRNGVYIVCSPKAGTVNKKLEPNICAYKYVLSANSIDPDDGLPIQVLGHSVNKRVARPKHVAYVYVQPADEKDEKLNKLNTDAAIRSAMKHDYIFQLQTHKLIGLE